MSFLVCRAQCKTKLITVLMVTLLLSTWTTPAISQTSESHNVQSTVDIPHVSDFVPPYACPWFFGRPASCNIPIKVSLECIDIRTIPANQLSRPFTEEELRNADKACELLPAWVDQDPRIVVVSTEKSKLHIRYEISPSTKLFSSTRIYIDNTNFQILGAFNQANKTAAYFVQESLIEIGNRGYLP